MVTGPLEKEQTVRDLLEDHFGVPFANRRLPLSSRDDNSRQRHRNFDAVSADGNVIAEVKSDKYTTKGFPTTRFPRAMLACRYLELCSAPTRIMIFTDRLFFEKFRYAAAGLLLADIEIVYADLDAELLIWE